MTLSNAAALRTQNDRCMTLKHRESYGEQTALHALKRSRGTLMSYADRLHGAASNRTHLYTSPSVGIKALTSPHHLLGKVK